MEKLDKEKHLMKSVVVNLKCYESFSSLQITNVLRANVTCVLMTYIL